MRCVLDYETRSRLNIKHVSAHQYANDFNSSIFCLGYKIDNGPKRLWIPERAPMSLDLWEAFKHGILVAHNASFERAITKWLLIRYDTLTQEQRDVLYSIPASRWRCTAAKAAACSLPRSLEMAAHVMQLKTKKDMYGSKLIQKYCKPRRPSKKDPSLWWHDAQDLKDIYKYCLIDVQAEYELDQALPDLTDDEQKVWELDQKINDRGVLIDIPTVKLILKMVHEETENITREVQRLSKGTIDKVTQHAKVLAWLNDHGADMTNLQAATIRDKLLEEDVPDKVREMLEYRQGGSKTSTAKYVKMLTAVSADGRARELLLYCGAQVTGRWAGKRIQPHNFPRPTVKGFNSDEAIALIIKGGLSAVRAKYGKSKVMDVLVSVIRGMLIASPGKELFCADFSAVELGLTFWVADHVEGLQAIKDKRKMYEEMAAATFDIDLKWLLTPEGKASIERFVGKESVLGCGYGMGWIKFLKNCHMKGVPQVTEKMAKKAVYTYRRVHWPVPEAWRNIEQAVIKAIREPGSRHSLHKVVVYKKGDFLNIKLPSGRRLRYFKPRLSYSQLASGKMVPVIHHWAVDSYTKQWCEVRSWGGVFFNNIVQGIARDLMMNAATNLENAGYEFLLSVHDEGLSEREKRVGNLMEYIKLMTKLPTWAEGAPIAAEGWVGLRYKK